MHRDFTGRKEALSSVPGTFIMALIIMTRMMTNLMMTVALHQTVCQEFTPRQFVYMR